MWKLAVLLLALLVRETTADCSCYESSYTGRSAPISNAFESTDFSSCYTAPCNYTAYSGDDTYGWTGLTFQWGTTNNCNGLLEIFDGPNPYGTPIIQVKEGEHVLSGSQKSQIKSSSPRINIRYSQDPSCSPNVYYGTIKALPGLQPTTTPGTTTTVQTTTPYSNPTYTNNPKLINHDMFIVINQKTSGGITALSNINAIAINLVNLLSVTKDANSPVATRLSLATLMPYYPYYSVKGMIWGLDSNDLFNNVPKSGITIEGNIDAALSGLVDLAFTVNTNSSTDSRRNVQRSIVLVTGEWPTTDATLNDTVRRKFADNGVDLLVVGYKLSDTELSQLLRTDLRWYNAVGSTQSNDIASFLNPFYLNDKSATNYWCPPFPVVNNTDGSVFFQEPYNYDGPYHVTDDWTTYDPFYGQNKRYCNFANNVYSYTLPDGFTKMKVQVFFELEAGKDFLNFYDDSNNLIASFTGYEISASFFYTAAKTLTARFISDNQSVFRGFYVSITPTN